MINPINTPPPKSSGGKGGLFGKIAGGVLGAVAAPLTGGTSIPAGMAIGGTAGGVVGELADPAKMSQAPVGPSPIESAVKRDPALQVGVLTDGQRALGELGLGPDQATDAFNRLEEAKKRIMNTPIYPR